MGGTESGKCAEGSAADVPLRPCGNAGEIGGGGNGGTRGGKLVGGGLAVLAGLLYGFQFFPFTLWAQYNPVTQGESSLLHSTRFFFSQFSGIWLTSAAALCVDWALRGGKVAAVSMEAMVPSILSGMIWAVAGMGCMIATDQLTYSVGYPLTMNCAFLVNTSWSLLY